MMAARFRSVLWVGATSLAALASYMVTQNVAAERAELVRTERAIIANRLLVRDLETELGARGSMAQMEKWNREVLALKAPDARQFLHGEVQLASLNAADLPKMEAKLVQVAATTAPAPAIAAPPAAVPAAPQPVAPAAAEPMLRHANYVKVADDHVAGLERKVSARGGGLLGDDALADISRIARTESAARQ